MLLTLLHVPTSPSQRIGPRVRRISHLDVRRFPFFVVVILRDGSLSRFMYALITLRVCSDVQHAFLTFYLPVSCLLCSLIHLMFSLQLSPVDVMDANATGAEGAEVT